MVGAEETETPILMMTIGWNANQKQTPQYEINKVLEMIGPGRAEWAC